MRDITSLHHSSYIIQNLQLNYIYCANNPVMLVDPDGRKVNETEASNSQVAKDFISTEFGSYLFDSFNNNEKVVVDILYADFKGSKKNTMGNCRPPRYTPFYPGKKYIEVHINSNLRNADPTKSNKQDYIKFIFAFAEELCHADTFTRFLSNEVKEETAWSQYYVEGRANSAKEVVNKYKFDVFNYFIDQYILRYGIPQQEAVNWYYYMTHKK